jgi:Flp pilus assembly protein TadB
MIKLLFFIALALFVFFFIFSFISYIKEKKRISKDKTGKSFNAKFKELSTVRKRIVVAFIIFFISAFLIQNIVFAVIFAVVYAYFDWFIKNKKAKELETLIDKQVIEALTIVKNAVQSGQSLAQAITTASQELKEPIKGEFIKMSDSLALGVNFDKVLQNSSETAPSKEFRLMIDTVKISKDSGASLTGIFDRILSATSQRIAIKSKVNALTSQGRMSGNVVSAMPFVVIGMMYIIEPGMMLPLFTTLAGNILLLIVIVMILTGSFVIRKITEIDF